MTIVRTPRVLQTALWLTLSVIVVAGLLPGSVHGGRFDLTVPQLWQHKDSDWIPCIVIDPPFCPSMWAHPDTCGPLHPYGNGCHHCAACAAPASIMMMRHYRGLDGGCPCCQDCLYDRAKFTDGEIPGNMVIESHGVGLRDEEVILGFDLALHEVHGFGNMPAPDLNPIPNTWALRALLAMGTPLLWIERNGFPYPGVCMPWETFIEMRSRGEGHAQVIAGYDDMGTYCMLDDDLVKIYDPWPPSGPYPGSPRWISVEHIYANIDDGFLSDRVGGHRVAPTYSDPATAWSNARSMVRDLTGWYGVLYANSGGIYFTKSWHPRDQGSWIDPVTVAPGGLGVIRQDPALAIRVDPVSPGAADQLHAFWAQAPVIPELRHDIYHSMSVDGGHTWTTPAPVHESQLEDSRHPSADVDGWGDIHVTWDETGLEFGREIFYSALRPMSPGWEPPIAISATPELDSSFPSLATSYDGEEFPLTEGVRSPARSVHVAWTERNPFGGPPVVVYRYLDPGLGWQPPLFLPPEDVSQTRPGQAPSLIVGPDREPHVVWTTSDEDPGAIPTRPAEIYYSSRAGGAWLAPALVSAPEPQATAAIAPSIAFANDAFCMCKHVVYERWTLGAGTASADIRLVTYSGMELAWVGHTSLTYEPVTIRAYPSLAYRNGTAYTKGYDLVWTGLPDPPLSDFAVRFLGTSAAGAAVSVEPADVVGLIVPAAWPNPFHDRVTITAPGDAGARVLRIFDLGGRLVRELTRDEMGSESSAGPTWIWDGRDAAREGVPIGVYYARIAGNAERGVRIVRLR